MSEKPKFYITTPIYYPSDNLHIGHSYCSTAADTMARFKKQTGYDVFFLTGTDEHGQKIERKAKEAGVTPKKYVDHIVAGIKDLWKLMDIDYSDFIRTTDERHVKSVQKIFRKLYDQGDIYKSEYEGWYCTPCESFWTELQLKDGCCPDCGRPVEKTRRGKLFLPPFQISGLAHRLYQNPSGFHSAADAHRLKCSITSSFPACRICAYRAHRSSGVFRSILTRSTRSMSGSMR